MNIRHLLCSTMVLLLLSGCETTPRSPDATAQMPFDVSAAEQDTAVSVSQDGNDYQLLAAESPVYLVDFEVFRDKSDDREGTGSRQVLVRHYAAAADVAIISVVDIESRRLVSVETVPNLPVPLSREEFDIAQRLAMADPRVASALEGIDVEWEAQLERVVDEQDPQFGHRILHFLFKTPDGYLTRPIVVVDVTAGEVIVE